MKTTFFTLVVLLVSLNDFLAQGYEINDARKKGIFTNHLDSIYKNAINTDSTLAVFRSKASQEKFVAAYHQLLSDWGEFLSSNHFYWDKPVQAFNRIYFNSRGKIDYFLYSFRTTLENELSLDKQKEFNRLLNIFISEYQFPVSAEENFVQCSPTKYLPKTEK